jgi:hypothetical protein
MGYTTDFEGQFHCYRPESAGLGVFLAAVREGDRATLGPLADWLSDHGDPRGAAVAEVFRGGGELVAFWQLFGLRPEHAAYLKLFNETRRMKRDAAVAARLPDPVREAVGLPVGSEGGYFVGAGGHAGQDRDESVLDYNEPPAGQPGLWCQWTPSEDRTAIVWDGGEKFYSYGEWLEYLIEHFLGPWGYVLNGEMRWLGEADEDRGTIRVADNVVSLEAEPY